MSKKIRKSVGLLVATGGLFGLVAFALSPSVGSAQQDERQALHWYHDHDAALAAAQKAHKPLMLDFGASWCTACKEIEKNVFPSAAFQKEARRFVVAHIDATEIDDKLQALFDKYEIRGLPAVIFFDAQGKQVPQARMNSYSGVEHFMSQMQKVK